ncbi:MAG: hypothetical protein FWH54_01320 [Methanobrevibacter sp.]|nr:hypothetical protein [Methanobrevibacter sp.]
MAKPIAPTPTLYGKEAEDFLDRLREPPSKEEIKFIKDLVKSFKDFENLE